MRVSKQSGTDVDLSKPLVIPSLDSEDCFGFEYNIRTKECIMCGDQLHCCAVFKKVQQKLAKEKNKVTKYLDTTDFSNINTDKLLLIIDGTDYLEILDYVIEKSNSKEELADEWLKYFLSSHGYVIDDLGMCRLSQ